MPDDINALRAEIFATLRGLRDKDNPIDVDTAKAVVEGGRTIIDTARVEVEMAKVTGQHTGSGFVPLAAPASSSIPAPDGTTIEKLPGGRVITHRMK